MNTEIATIFVQSLKRSNVWSSFHDLIHPLDCSHHLISLSLGEHWRTFVLRDLLCVKRETLESVNFIYIICYLFHYDICGQTIQKVFLILIARQFGFLVQHLQKLNKTDIFD